MALVVVVVCVPHNPGQGAAAFSANSSERRKNLSLDNRIYCPFHLSIVLFMKAFHFNKI